MKPGLPSGAAVVVLGPRGAALGRRVSAVLPGARLYGPRGKPGVKAGDWDIFCQDCKASYYRSKFWPEPFPSADRASGRSGAVAL